MRKMFSEQAWSDYLYRQKEDKKTIKRINDLIRDVERNGNTGIGRPEPLRDNLSGYWSRRINEKDRLVYRIEEERIYIVSCKHHHKK